MRDANEVIKQDERSRYFVCSVKRVGLGSISFPEIAYIYNSDNLFPLASSLPGT